MFTHNQAIKSFAMLTRTLRSAAAPRRLLLRYRAEESSAYLSGWKSPSGKG